MRGFELNETFERVADLLADRLDLSVDQLREIANEVDDIESAEEKNKRILNLAAAIPCGPIHPTYLPKPQIHVQQVQSMAPTLPFGSTEKTRRRLRNSGG